MRSIKPLISFLGVLVMILALAACKRDVRISDLSVYPNSIELLVGPNSPFDLGKFIDDDGVIRHSFGAREKIEHRGFLLPEDVSLDAVKDFYQNQLNAQGWVREAGEIAGGMIDQLLYNAMMKAKSNNTQYVQAYGWIKGKQTLTVTMVTTSTVNREILILALAKR